VGFGAKVCPETDRLGYSELNPCSIRPCVLL
jgi:hypothetical protein